MNKHIIIINGTGGSGKDTFISLCAKYAKVMNFSSVDKVKEIAKQIGWNGGKTEKDRKLLSDLKKLTTEYNDMAFKSILEAYHQFQSSDYEILFIHIREPEEIQRAVSTLNAQSLEIKRVGLSNISTNYSDASVDNYPYDYIIESTTLEELERSAINFVQEITKNQS